MAVVTRTLQISAALGSWLMEGRLTNRGASAQALTDARAAKLRRLLTQLGPAFVKIGQAVSSRWVPGQLVGTHDMHAAVCWRCGRQARLGWCLPPQPLHPPTPPHPSRHLSRWPTRLPARLPWLPPCHGKAQPNF